MTQRIAHSGSLVYICKYCIVLLIYKGELFKDTLYAVFCIFVNKLFICLDFLCILNVSLHMKKLPEDRLQDLLIHTFTLCGGLGRLVIWFLYILSVVIWNTHKKTHNHL